MNSKPLISFVLLAYKQEKFIREAVDGALSQTYSPLEIILSDDCSPDRTFEIIQEMVDSYSGTHKIILNRNENNLGIGQHFNRVMDMAKGELIIMAAGDDISLANRTEDLVNEWLEVGKPDGICSSIININQDGIEQETDFVPWLSVMRELLLNNKDISIFSSNASFTLLGGSAAWSKKCWESFGSLNNDVISEDYVMSFRASISNGLYISLKKLVKYRNHENNMTNTNQILKYKNKELSTPEDYLWVENSKNSNAKRNLPVFKNIISDWKVFNENPTKISYNETERISKILNKEIVRNYLIINWEGLSIFNKVSNINRISSEPFLIKLLRLFPQSRYILLRCYLALVKRKFKEIFKMAF